MTFALKIAYYDSMKHEIEQMREATRELARNGRLSALSRVQGAPPLRTLTTFNTGGDPSGRTLKRLELALTRFEDSSCKRPTEN